MFVNMAKGEKKYARLNKVNKTGQYLSMAYEAINKSIEENIQFKFPGYGL
jgi:hypothetical protein